MTESHDPRPPSPSEEGSSILDVLLILSRNKRLVVLAPLVAGILAFGLSFLITPRFTASIQLMPPQQQQSTAAALLGSLGGLVGGAASGLKNPSDQWIGLLKSRTVADALIKRFDLQKRYALEYQFQVRKELDARTSISAGKDSLIDIEVEDTDPKVAADIANAYVDELQNLSKVLAVGEAAQRRLFFENQLKDAKAQLVKAEIALRESGVSESVLKTSPDAAVEGIARLKAQITETEVRISVLRGTHTAENPELQQLQRELGSLRAQLAGIERNEPNGQRAGNGASYVSRYRDFKYYETLFELMARQYELAKADEAKEGALVQIVDAALVPEWKSSPKRVLIALLATLATLTITVIFVLSRESLRVAKTNDPAIAAKLAQLKSGQRTSGTA